MSARCTISLLTYTAVEHSKRCIASVLQNTPKGMYELILTANGNPEAAVFFESVRIQNQDIPIRVVMNDTNQGFIPPNTKALEMTETEFFVMLNDDALVPPGWLEKMLHPMEDVRVALTGPKGSCCSLNDNFHGYVGQRLEYLEGSCLMGRTKLLKEIGLFSPYLEFAYGEDSDLSLRVREKGWLLGPVDFKLVHARAQTSSKVKGIREYQEKNHAALRKRWAHYLRTRRFDYPILVRRGGAHGDVLLMTPVLKALKKQHPLSPIYVQTRVPEVLTRNPHIVQASMQPVSMAHLQIINLDGSYEAVPDRHFIETYAQVCGVPPVDKVLEVFPSDGDRLWAKGKVPEAGWIAVHPGPSTWKGKEWPKDRFNTVVQELRYRGHKVVLVGSHDAGIEADCDLRGRTTIMQMATVIQRCRLFVGLDSLPMHVSQAVGTPTIGLFGVTDPTFIATAGSWFRAVCGTGPSFGARHRVKGQTHLQENGECIRTITVEQVLKTVEEGLAL